MSNILCVWGRGGLVILYFQEGPASDLFLSAKFTFPPGYQLDLS